MMKAIQKSQDDTNTKTMTKTTTKTKTKTQTKCLKTPTYAIFLKSWWLTHSNMMIDTSSCSSSYNQFYRAECITVSGFLLWKKRKYISTVSETSSRTLRPAKYLRQCLPLSIQHCHSGGRISDNMDDDYLLYMHRLSWWNMFMSLCTHNIIQRLPVCRSKFQNSRSKKQKI